MEEVCGSEKETCKEFVNQYRREIQKLLISSATEVAKPSRGVNIDFFKILLIYKFYIINVINFKKLIW